MILIANDTQGVLSQFSIPPPPIHTNTRKPKNVAGKQNKHIERIPRKKHKAKVFHAAKILLVLLHNYYYCYCYLNNHHYYYVFSYYYDYFYRYHCYHCFYHCYA